MEVMRSRVRHAVAAAVAVAVAGAAAGAAVLLDPPSAAPARTAVRPATPAAPAPGPTPSPEQPVVRPTTAAPAAPAVPATPVVPGVRPVLPLDGVTVALDPGHNRDNGAHAATTRSVDAGGFRKPCNTTGTATDDGYPESRFAMELADRLADRLRGLGADVPLTRDRDAGWGPCVDVRGRFGALVGADLLLSLHADGSTTPGHAGFHVIRPGLRRGWTDDVEAPSARLATAVRDALVDAGFRPSNYRGRDGVDVRDDLGTLNWADVPTVVVESHNMRDAQEAALFRSAAGQDRFAAALAEAVRAYLGR